MKVAVIGGGSTYTPELVEGLLARRERLDLDAIALVDTDDRRLGIVGPLAQRMAAATEQGQVAVSWGRDVAAAVDGASFVVSQIRVGGQAARDRDEQLGREFGLIGQETVGVGGFANALRTIPVALRIAGTIAEVAPDAVLCNFTNPAGLVTEALCRHGRVATVGLCNIPWTVRALIAGSLRVDPGTVELDYVGLNHLSWIRGVRVEGADRSAEVLDGYRALAASGDGDGEPGWTPEALRIIDAVPNDYLRYYYETAAMLEHQARRPTRASEVMAIEERLLAQYEDPALDHKPPELALRGGAFYSEAAAALMADLWSGDRAVHVVNTPNRGAIPGLPDDVVVEVSARVGPDGVTTLPVDPLRPDVDALLRTMKDVELLTVSAAVHGDEDAALRALVAHPLGPDASEAPAVWARLRELNRGLLGRLDV